MSKKSKMMSLIHYRLRITLKDSRVLIGQMLAYDKHMNLVMAETDEFRQIRKKKGKTGGEEEETGDGTEEIKRPLGLVILRGEVIVSISVEGPPPANTEEKGPGILAGPGRGAPAGRGISLGGPPQPPMMRGGPVPFGAPPGAPGAGRGFMPPGMPPGMMPPPPGMPGGPPPGFRPPGPGFPGGPPQGFPAFPPPPGFQPGPPR